MFVFGQCMYLVWFDRCDLPSCWTALSALQGNSMVTWTRRHWLTARRSACNEIPVQDNSMSLTNDITWKVVILNYLESSRCTRWYKTANKILSCLVTYRRYLFRFLLPEENSFIPVWVEFQVEKHQSKVRVSARNSKQWQLNWTLTGIEPAILCVKVTWGSVALNFQVSKEFKKCKVLSK